MASQSIPRTFSFLVCMDPSSLRLTRRDVVDRLAGSKFRSAHLDWRICSIRMLGPRRYRRRILTIFPISSVPVDSAGDAKTLSNR